MPEAGSATILLAAVSALGSFAIVYYILTITSRAAPGATDFAARREQVAQCVGAELAKAEHRLSEILQNCAMISMDAETFRSASLAQSRRNGDEDDGDAEWESLPQANQSLAHWLSRSPQTMDARQLFRNIRLNPPDRHIEKTVRQTLAIFVASYAHEIQSSLSVIEHAAYKELNALVELGLADGLSADHIVVRDAARRARILTDLGKIPDEHPPGKTVVYEMLGSKSMMFSDGKQPFVHGFFGAHNIENTC